jgi:lysylphosphatidylglycerol synthetase-like protein (DUF2156 family)
MTFIQRANLKVYLAYVVGLPITAILLLAGGAVFIISFVATAITMLIAGIGAMVAAAGGWVFILLDEYRDPYHSKYRSWCKHFTKTHIADYEPGER